MANHIHAQHQAGKHILERLTALGSKHPAAKTYIDRMVSNATPLVTKTHAVADIVDTPNPTLNEAANFERLSKKLDAYAKEATAALNDSSQERNEAIKALNEQADTRLKLNAKSDNHNAFMLRFAGMSKSEIWREAVVAMKDGDSEFMGTLLKSHPFLSGLSSVDMQRLRSDYVKAHAPDLADGLNAIDEAFNAVLAIDRVTQTVKFALSNPSRLADIRRGVDASEQAEAAFDNPAATT
jgi:hypothetical protein